MSKEATIIQSFNDVKRQYEYSVKGYDVTESGKILLTRHKEEYDKEKNIFAGIDGYLEAQKECQSQISDLEAKLAEKDKQQNQKAIEQLEKVREFCEKELKECDKLLKTEFEDDFYIQSVMARESMCFDFRRTIDSQIKQLKGKK